MKINGILLALFGLNFITACQKIEPPVDSTPTHSCLEVGYPATIHYENTDSFGDGYISHVLVADMAGKSDKEIVIFLVRQWLEHYKTESTSSMASIDDYEIEDVLLLDSSCDPFFKLVAGVRFSVIPSQVPHDMGSFPGEAIKEGDIWWHLSMPVGVFIDGSYYRLRLVFGWGT